MTVDQQAGNTVLEKNKQQARAEAITAPDLDQLFGGHLNLALMHPFATSWQLDQAPLEDDLFVMPTIPDSVEDGSTHHHGQQRHRTATREPLPLAMPDRHIVGLPTGLELQDTMLMDQEETFMMPELGMDMFDTDMPAVPGMPDNEPEEEVRPPPQEMMEEPVQATDAEPLQEDHAVAAEAMPDQDVREAVQEGELQQPPAIGSLEAIVEEQAVAEGAARQARAKAKGRGRKRSTPLIIDDADAVQIRGTVFRAWTQNTDELVLERPHKLLRPLLVSQYPGCRPSALPSGADLLCGAPLSAMCGQGGKWGEELQPLFVSRVTPNTAQGDRCHQEKPQQQPEYQEVDTQEMHPQDMGVLDEVALAGPTAAAADIDLPEHTANDIFLLEEEVEVERLRAALATPGSMSEQDHAKAVQLGLTPGSSNPLERRGQKKQKRTSSGFRVESGSRPTEDSPHSQRRLSDLMVGVDVGEVGLGLEGHLEDLIAPELEGMPQQEDALDQRLEAAGGLTQFQLMEDSAPATQTQRAVTDAITKNTLSMIGLLRDRFTDLEEQGSEEPALSVFQMTASLTRPQAAKLFYQICVTHSNNFIQATQGAPYGDILINRGAFL
ncbi:hypothetical protein ABBQ38_013748 [Trebouxia sp. C0009 RCD-2024]